MIEPTGNSEQLPIDAKVIEQTSSDSQAMQPNEPTKSNASINYSQVQPVEPDLLTESVSAQTTDRCKYLSWPMRLMTMFSGAVLLALLVIARGLTPSASGFGTHEQLGLPPCTAIVLLNIPCPACGMTTSWAHTTRGDFVAAAQCNAGGMLLALIAMAFLPASCYFFLRGKASSNGWFSLVLAICLVAALGVSLVQWVIRLLN
ncbi:MAG: DUF2752 domain-containing protein [Pirellulales bacterium]